MYAAARDWPLRRDPLADGSPRPVLPKRYAAAEPDPSPLIAVSVRALVDVTIAGETVWRAGSVFPCEPQLAEMLVRQGQVEPYCGESKAGA